MEILDRTQFGNPILREKARKLSKAEVLTPRVQELIRNMRHTLAAEKLGVGLAAPQVGKSVALAIIAIQPTAHRPDVETFNRVLINPMITDFIGPKKPMWEGCISTGNDGTAGLFAKVPRFEKVEATFLDENAELCHEAFEGLAAQVVQHETDHLDGRLFVDRVTDPTTYMTYSEYMLRVKGITPQG